MIEIKNLSFAFQGEPVKPIFQKLNLTIPQGHFVSIIGKSGSGKSTLFKLLTRELSPQEGEIYFKGGPIQSQDAAYMPQKDLLLPWDSILNNVLLPQRLNPNLSPDPQAGIAWLEKAGLAPVKDSLPQDLSGGMRQRAAFVRTLMNQRQVLLLDEPFGALDYFTQKEMQDWLLRLWEDMNATIILVTHNIEEAIYLSDQVVVLHPLSDQGHQSQVQSFPIHFPRPRQEAIRYSSDFIHYKRQLEGAIQNDPS